MGNTSILGPQTRTAPSVERSLPECRHAVCVVDGRAGEMEPSGAQKSLCRSQMTSRNVLLLNLVLLCFDYDYALILPSES